MGCTEKGGAKGTTPELLEPKGFIPTNALSKFHYNTFLLVHDICCWHGFIFYITFIWQVLSSKATYAKYIQPLLEQVHLSQTSNILASVWSERKVRPVARNIIIWSRGNNEYRLQIFWKSIRRLWGALCWTTNNFNPGALLCSDDVNKVMRMSWGSLSEPAKSTSKQGSTRSTDVYLSSSGSEFRRCLWCLTSPWSKTQTLLSAEGCDEKSQMCRDLCVWPAES